MTAALAFLIAQSAPPSTIEEALRKAKNHYAYGNYEQAIEAMRSLLYPMRLTTDAEVIEARKYLALSYYLTDQLDEAREEFGKLLYLDPDHELDPYVVAPPVVEMFEKTRKKLKPQLDIIRERTSQEDLGRPQPVALKRIIETRVTEKSEVATLLPFGVGQFQNDQVGWGIFFATSELVLLGLNIGSYLWALKTGDFATDEPKKRKLIESLTITQFASAAMLGVVWSVGVFHARLYFVPTVVSPPKVRDVPLSPQSSWEGFTMRFGFSY